MPREINFLSDRNKAIVKQETEDRKIMMMCAAVLAVCFGIFVITSGIQLYFSFQLSKIKQEETALRAQIVGDQETERNFVVFVHKLASLAQIDQDRQDKKMIIQFFSTYFGSAISIVGVEFDQNQKLLTLKLESNSIFDLKGVLSRLSEKEVTDKFSSINPSNLTRTQDAKYQVDVTISTVTPNI
jgi:hypothetical protein